MLEVSPTTLAGGRWRGGDLAPVAHAMLYTRNSADRRALLT